MPRCLKRSTWLACLCVVFAWGCRKNGDQESAESPSPQTDPAGAELIFPDVLRVADESVNIFVRSALKQCASGKYEAFRVLWSAKREPISRNEFEEGWHAVRRMEVRGLRKALLELEPGREPEPVYALLVEVSLDPQARASRRARVREIVLLLVEEHGEWRLASAPKEIREWIKKEASPSSP